MSDTDWIVKCVKCSDNFEGADMIPLDDDEWVCADCLPCLGELELPQ
jgi:hypothetical protein